MKTTATATLVVMLVAAALGAGYWLGAKKQPEPIAAVQPAAKPQPKVLYYRNPMGLPDTSPVPKKDQMGMDYIPVYEGEEPETGQVRISAEKIQKLGVKTEAAALREVARTLRAVGMLQVDERRLHTVAPRFEGWIERLHVNVTGQAVARGQALMEAYSPELVSAQQEYAIAWAGVQSLKDGSAETRTGMRQLAESSLQRLRNWDISPAQIERLKQDGKPQRTLTLVSPVNGVVLEKPAVQGMRFMPGEVLYRIADLSSLWLLAEIAEQDVGLARVGQAARITVSAYPGKTFEGKVTFVSPMLNPQTRTAQVRIELANAGNLLKPAMYANVELPAAGGTGKVLAVPVSAVLDSGTRQVALVEIADGRFEPREVKVGRRSDDYLEILEGLGEGEKVVVGANFLIDAESSLKAALGSFGGHEGHGAAAPKAAQEQPAPAPAHGGH